MHKLNQESNGQFTDVTIGFVGGGSRSWGTKMINDLAQQQTMNGEVRLYDVDYESAAQNARLGRMVQDRDDVVSEWEYTAVDSLGDALDGADFVILSTQDPPAETMAKDLDIPDEYGITQTVGDTVGPGGALRAMRAIPQYREIAASIREHCPDVWVLNYTNPMTVCTRTLYEEFPEINAIGLCHEVLHVQDYLADLVETHYDISEVNGEDIDVNVKGINHFTWVDEARWQGKDIFPAIDEELEEQLPIPGGLKPGDLDDESYFVDNYQVTFDLYRKFGALPAAGDRHLVEFVPWYLEVDRPEDVQRWGIRVTPSEHRVNHWPENEDERQQYLDGERAFEFTDTGEEMVEIMSALLGNGALKTNVNIPNAGQVSGLDEGAVVETNALLTADAITPLEAGSLPDVVESIVDTHVTNQETLVEAGFAGDLDLAFQAFLNDPLVSIQPDAARELFTDLIEAERSYLSDWNLENADVLNR